MLAANPDKTKTDYVGRVIPVGAVLDPATTRAVTAGSIDPVSGLMATTTGYVRDPFSLTCGATTRDFTACGDLNQIPGGRIDQKAATLLNLYPNPTSSGPTANFSSSPALYEHKNSFDVRGDFNPEEKDQIFFRYSYSDDPQFIPGPFGGIADGGAFQQGNQGATSHQMVAAYTHVFTQSTINQVRGGFAHLHTTRNGPVADQLGIPDQYGIQGIPQVAGNGGLPAFSFQGLATLGSNSFLPSDEISQTLQISDDFTKVYGKHGFKMGVEYQHVKFSTLQPAWSHGQWDYNGSFTDMPNQNSKTNGIADFLIPPTTLNASIPADVGVPYSGGSDQAYASNISKTYDERTYFAGYFQDDWKISPRLTINLGLRWDYFSPISESNGAQANFIASGPPGNKPEYLIPASGKADRSLSSTANNPSLAGNGFLDLIAKDGIALNETNEYGKALVQTQKGNVAPRIGFAYQSTQKFVVRGGFGIFYNSFENQGYGPNIGENYPFVYNFDYIPRGTDSVVAPISSGTPFAGCPTAGPGGTATFEAGFSCVGFSPLNVNASGLSLQGLQFDYQTPRTYSANLSLQYALSRSLSAQVAYVLTNGTHRQTGVGVNDVRALLPSGQSTNDTFPNNEVPFPRILGRSSSYHPNSVPVYNGLQAKLEQQVSSGLTYLLTYTYSKTMSDAGDLLNGGSQPRMDTARHTYPVWDPSSIGHLPTLI